MDKEYIPICTKNNKKDQRDVGKWGESGECLCILSILGNIRGREVV